MNAEKPKILVSFIKATLFVLFFQMVFVYAFAETTNNYLIENPFNLPHTEDNPFALRAGDLVIVRPRILNSPNPLTDEFIRYHYHLNPNRPAGLLAPGGTYWHYRIIRTWVDFNMQSDVLRHHNFRKLGIRPLRNSEVELEDLLKTGQERIYDISDIALTQNIKSRFYDIGDLLVYRKTDGSKEVYKDASVEGLFLNGDLAVRYGNTYDRVTVDNSFSKTKNYLSDDIQFRIGEAVYYRFERPSSDLVTYEQAKILGISPSGEILIFHNRLNSYVRIPSDLVSKKKTLTPKIISEKDYLDGFYTEEEPHFMKIRKNNSILNSCKKYFSQ